MNISQEGKDDIDDLREGIYVVIQDLTVKGALLMVLN